MEAPMTRELRGVEVGAFIALPFGLGDLSRSNYIMDNLGWGGYDAGMKILVLGGGVSGEREVSLRSAAAVVEALKTRGHEVTQLDPRDDGAELPVAMAACDVVLPILHGAGGEDGSIQAVIEAAGRPYLGSGVTASKLAFDKVAFKEALAKQGLPTPKYEVVDAAGFERSGLRARPFVLKPVDGGSSLDTFMVRDVRQLPAVLAPTLARYGKMLLEELVEGVEITVAVLGEETLPVVEIVPPAGGEFDYENKYNGVTAELCPPQHVSAAVQERAQRLAEEVHRLVGCRHLSRTDLMVMSDGALTVLEINTMPGLTDQSLFPKAAAAAGIDWEHLVERFVEMAAA
jgi:D-alanine-D-alanine ligase